MVLAHVVVLACVMVQMVFKMVFKEPLSQIFIDTNQRHKSARGETEGYFERKTV